jgi:hypothetical protein
MNETIDFEKKREMLKNKPANIEQENLLAIKKQTARKIDKEIEDIKFYVRTSSYKTITDLTGVFTQLNRMKEKILSDWYVKIEEIQTLNDKTLIQKKQEATEFTKKITDTLQNLSYEIAKIYDQSKKLNEFIEK